MCTSNRRMEVFFITFQPLFLSLDPLYTVRLVFISFGRGLSSLFFFGTIVLVCPVKMLHYALRTAPMANSLLPTYRLSCHSIMLVLQRWSNTFLYLFNNCGHRRTGLGIYDDVSQFIACRFVPVNNHKPRPMHLRHYRHVSGWLYH